MKQSSILTLTAAGIAGLFALPAMGQQETARVISSTPIIQQVAVPRQVCSNQQVVVPSQKSGAGAAMGAIAGGAMGNAIGDGSGRAVATILGVIGGAILGDKIEGAPAPQTQNVQQCSTQNFFENRTVAYNVVYEFGGKQYSVQMPNDPGPTLRLQITPLGGSAQTPGNESPVPAAPAQPAVIRSGTVVLPATVVVTDAYPYHYRPYYYPPVGVTFNLGYGRAHHGHWNHWR